MILGTAGHIDHGKTTLVRALTGVDTDRLPEEKRRGITIDLGFAPLELEGVGRVGVVDVPGHEAFVRTMVAGATGIDLALVVVAADSGVMPQTREHLSILSLLGVHRGVVAITKRDLVDDEWLALVEEDVRATLVTTTLAGAAIVPVSSTTGAGLDALRHELAEAARAGPARASSDLFRLPVDRAFSIRGTGTVVTGTVWTGSLTRDATVRLFPADVSVRVRGLQAHGRAVDSVHAGDRAAISLAGVELEQVSRGAMVVQGDGWRANRVLRVDVAMLDDASVSLGPRSRVRMHLGTTEVGARLVVREGTLTPGARTSARLVLDEAIVARGGDRFVVRAGSPVATLGGGIVIDPHAPLRARPWPLAPRDALTTLTQMADDAGALGVAVRDLPVRIGVRPDEVDALLAAGGGWRVAGLYVEAGVRSGLEATALDVLRVYHEQHQLEPGAPIQWLRSRLGAGEEVSSAIVNSLIERGSLAVGNGVVRLATFTATLPAALASLRASVVHTLESAGAEPPSVDELASLLNASTDDVLAVTRWLSREGTLVAVEPARYYAWSAVQGLKERMTAGMTGGHEYAPAELRDLLGLTRKFLIPFLEYCDREGYTIRAGLGRRLAVRKG